MLRCVVACLVGVFLDSLVLAIVSTDYLLSEEEVLNSTGGTKRHFSSISYGNDVLPLVDGFHFFTRLSEEWQTVKKGDFVGVIAWDIGLRYMLEPPSSSTSIKNMLKAASARGAEQAFLVNDNPTATCQIDAFVEEVENTRLASVGRHYHDTFYYTGSHHSKAVVITQGKGGVAFMGGMDLSAERYDTQAHVDGDQTRRNSQPQLRMCDVDCALPCDRVALDHKGWHDIAIQMKGPVVADVLTHFSTRWEHHGQDSLSKDYASKHSREKVGTHAVQITRTATCREFAYLPEGELTYLDAMVKAIKQARTYVYIEDQYSWYVPEIVEALKIAIEKKSFKCVIVLAQDKSELPGQELYQKDFIDKVLESTTLAKEKFRMFYRKDGVYIHAKATIVDDIFVNIGSANRNERSMYGDTELGISVVDTTLITDGFMPHKVSRFARDLRHSLWAEHFGLPTSHVSSLTINECVEMWDEIANTPLSRIGVLGPEVEWWMYFATWYQDFFEPDGRCGANTCSNNIFCVGFFIIFGIVMLVAICCCCICQQKCLECYIRFGMKLLDESVCFKRCVRGSKRTRQAPVPSRQEFEQNVAESSRCCPTKVHPLNDKNITPVAATAANVELTTVKEVMETEDPNEKKAVESMKPSLSDGIKYFRKFKMREVGDKFWISDSSGEVIRKIFQKSFMSHFFRDSNLTLLDTDDNEIFQCSELTKLDHGCASRMVLFLAMFCCCCKLCCVWRFAQTRFAIWNAKGEPLGQVTKRVLLPVFFFYTKDGELKYEVEGDLFNSTFLVYDANRELKAVLKQWTVSTALNQITDSLSSYDLFIHPECDVDLMIAFACIMDELVEAESL